MLLKYKGKIDTDGYLMLLLSALTLTATAGISYFICLRKIYLPAKHTKPHCEDDVVVCVLGKKLLNNKPDDEYLLRLKRAKQLLEKDQKSDVILLGGKTGRASISEAYAGKEFLLMHNIPESRIYLEQESQNTLENILNATEFLEEKNKKIVVVSNRYHLARAKRLAQGLGVQVEPCAAEEFLELNLAMVTKLALEALHVHWYLVGRYYAHATNNKRMIERVG